MACIRSYDRLTKLRFCYSVCEDNTKLGRTKEQSSKNSVTSASLSSPGGGHSWRAPGVLLPLLHGHAAPSQHLRASSLMPRWPGQNRFLLKEQRTLLHFFFRVCCQSQLDSGFRSYYPSEGGRLSWNTVASSVQVGSENTGTQSRLYLKAEFLCVVYLTFSK